MKRLKYLTPICLLLSLIYSSAIAAPLKIGVLQIEDSVPLYVAEKEKFYSEAGLEIKLIPFLSALERDSALTAGAIDGAVSDPVGAILFDQGRDIIKITSLCLGLTPYEGVFAILAAPGSNIKTVDDLKNAKIGISNATIIDYITDRLMENQGVSPADVQTIEVKKMPIRMQMLLSNAIEAATLPEPLASIAVGKGARIILSDANSPTSLSQTVMIFRSSVVASRADDVKRFFHALTLGVQAINKDPERFRELFVAKGRIPPFLAKAYPIPHYPEPAAFPRTLFDPIVSWLKAKQLAGDVQYEKLIASDLFTK